MYMTADNNEKPNKISKKELLETLKHVIQTSENLPAEAKIMPVNNYELLSLLYWLQALLEADLDSDSL